MSTEISYTEAFEELQNIANEIEQGQISVDELSQKVKRASELIRICNDRLYTTEEDVKKILEELETNSSPHNNNPHSNNGLSESTHNVEKQYNEPLEDLPF